MLTRAPEKGHAVPDPFEPFVHTLPDAETVARRLGGRKAGENDWRIPHLCGGDAPGAPLGDNPGLSIGNGTNSLIVKCYHGCDAANAYAAVRAALGIDNRRTSSPSITPWLYCPDCKAYLPADRPIPRTGWPALTCSCGTSYDRLLSAIASEPWTAWAEYRLADGKPRRMVRRFPPRQDGPKSTWAREPVGPNGTRPRRPAVGLTPLVWGTDAPGACLLIVEGEKAAAALVSAGVHNLGYTPVSTQSAAGMATADYAALVSGRNVIIWPDADPLNERTSKRPGPEAANKAAERIQDAGALSVRVVDPKAAAELVPDGGKRKGADAADVRPEHLPQLLQDAAATVTPQETNRNTDAHAITVDPIPQKPDKKAMRAAGWLMDKHGRINGGSNRNAILALEAMGVAYWNDDWHRVTRNSDGDQINRKILPDAVKADIERTYARINYSPTKGSTEAAINLSAEANKYNPVLDRLNAITWDGIDRTTHFGHDAFRTEDTELQNEQAALIARGAVVRALEPGAIFPYTPILYSRKQGKAKGDALAIIAPGGFVSGVSFGDLDWEKKLGEKIGGTSIAELAEMSGLSPRELRNAKDMATRTKLKYRAAYDYNSEDYPLQTIIVATTNERHMLTDTEHRRTPVIEVPDGKEINLEWLRANIEQVWAQIAHEYHQGRYQEAGPQTAVRMPQHLWEAANQQSDDHRVEDGLEVWLRKHCTGPDGLRPQIASSDLWDAIHDTKGPRRPSNQAVSRVMGALGYISSRLPGVGDRARTRAWVLINPPINEPWTDTTIPSGTDGTDGTDSSREPGIRHIVHDSDKLRTARPDRPVRPNTTKTAATSAGLCDCCRAVSVLVDPQKDGRAKTPAVNDAWNEHDRCTCGCGSCDYCKAKASALALLVDGYSTQLVRDMLHEVEQRYSGCAG